MLEGAEKGLDHITSTEVHYREYHEEGNTRDEDYDYESHCMNTYHLHVQKEHDPGKAGRKDAPLICAERRILPMNY